MPKENKLTVVPLDQVKQKPHQSRRPKNLQERHVVALEKLVANLTRVTQVLAEDYFGWTYEEAQKATTLSRTVLENLIATKKLVKGRHYIKIGRRIIFNKDLVRLMFEDQLIEDKEIKRKAPSQKKAKPLTIKTTRKPSDNPSGLDLNYR